MGEELKQRYSADVELVKGGGGVFDVRVDDVLVYSKFETGRFPQPGEVVGLIAEGGYDT